jgi:hypothetical protein
MQEEQNQIGTTQTKVELQIIPNDTNVELNNGKIMLSITCDGSKLTKADSGYTGEITQEIWASVKLNKADGERVPDVVVDVHEKCGSKLTKADAGIA